MCSLPHSLSLSLYAHTDTLCKDNTRPILHKVVKQDSNSLAAAEIKKKKTLKDVSTRCLVTPTYCMFAKSAITSAASQSVSHAHTDTRQVREICYSRNLKKTLNVPDQIITGISVNVAAAASLTEKQRRFSPTGGD